MAVNYKSKIKKAMQAVGTYKKEHETAIEICAGMLADYDEAMSAGGGEKFLITDGEKTVKNPLYAIKEKLRADILVYLRELGLTPAGLRKMQQQEETKENKSKLVEVLGELTNGKGK